MTQDELNLVLDALKFCHGGEPCGTAEAIAVVEKALAQPEQEPIAFYNPQQGGFYWAKPTTISCPQTVDVTPLAFYTTPPQRKPLSLHELSKIFASIPSIPFDGDWQLELVRAIEAAHGIKGDA